MKHAAYPKYKKSGVEWLGDVPGHWEVKRLKNSADYCVSNVNKVPSENEIPVRLCNYTDVYYNDFITSDMELMETTATKEEIEKFHLNEEDVVITKDSESWDDIAISSLVIKTTPDLVCGYHLAIIRPKKEKLSGRYLLRQFQCSEVNHQFQIAATGVTRYGLPKSAIGEALIPLPPFSEQLSIADFLDRETGRIDTLIGKKQKFVELLKEKRTALISHAVTKGLNPKVKMKSSGVEWLGDVPVHWEVKKLKHISNSGLCNGIFKTNEFFGDGTLLVNVFDIFEDDYFIKTSKLERIQTNVNEKEKYSAKIGDIFFVRSSLKQEGIATAAVLEELHEEAVFECHLIRVRPNNQTVCTRYEAYYFNSSQIRSKLISLAETTTMTTISQGKLSSLEVLCPPLYEQQAIASFLDHEISKIDALIAKVETAIEKLKEYRTALISATVTGKIDVREVA